MILKIKTIQNKEAYVVKHNVTNWFQYALDETIIYLVGGATLTVGMTADEFAKLYEGKPEIEPLRKREIAPLPPTNGSNDFQY